MRIAITGGTGFVGGHLARALCANGHEVVLVARGQDRRDPQILTLPGACFFPADLGNAGELTRAFAACGAVAHCAGINRELGQQTYRRVQIEGTRNVAEAARRAGVGKVVLLSFLRARPNRGSAYHESKWAAEEIVRNAGLDYTVVKAGVIYGRGDHMLDHLSHALHTFPLFALVGLRDKPIRPLAVEDLVRILEAALLCDRLSRQTVAVTGPKRCHSAKRCAAWRRPRESGLCSCPCPYSSIGCWPGVLRPSWPFRWFRWRSCVSCPKASSRPCPRAARFPKIFGRKSSSPRNKFAKVFHPRVRLV